MLRQIPVFPIGGDGSWRAGLWPTEAEGAVSGVLVFMVEIALGAKAAPTPSMARWIDIEEFLVWRETGGLMLYSLKEIQGDATGVLVRVEENEVFPLLIGKDPATGSRKPGRVMAFAARGWFSCRTRTISSERRIW